MSSTTTFIVIMSSFKAGLRELFLIDETSKLNIMSLVFRSSTSSSSLSFRLEGDVGRVVDVLCLVVSVEYLVVVGRFVVVERLVVVLRCLFVVVVRCLVVVIVIGCLVAMICAVGGACVVKLPLPRSPKSPEQKL